MSSLVLFVRLPAAARYQRDEGGNGTRVRRGRTHFLFFKMGAGYPSQADSEMTR